MNQSEIWLVVKPTVGLPLFLGSVAITSLLVHAAILTHTTWMGGYWQGNTKAKVSEMAPAGNVVVGSTMTVPGTTVVASLTK
jgi:light-harvesting protein B-800-850 alpha chain